MAAEFVATYGVFRIDREGNRVLVTPIVGWHEAEFIEAYPDAPPQFGNRSPIERAVVGFARPLALPTERAFLDANQFALSYQEFDWRLNDLSGGRRHDLRD